MKDNLELAKIVLFVYNRPHHTLRTLNALASNFLALDSELIIYSDGPKNKSETDNVLAVRKIIKDTTGFKSIKIVEGKVNYGLAKSVIQGVSEVLKKSQDVIVMEDDLETAPYFLQFMNNALNFYRNDKKAFSIGGYQFPISALKIPRSYPYDTYSSYRCCSWGWATWSDRWCDIDWDTVNYVDLLADPLIRQKFNRGGADMADMLEMQANGKIDSWAIRFCFAQFIKEAYCITPTKTLVRNIGLDNSGVHCGIDPRREHLKLDMEWLPRHFSPAYLLNDTILRKYRDAFGPRTYKEGILINIKRLIGTMGAHLNSLRR